MASYPPIIDTPEAGDFVDARPLKPNLEGLKALGFFPQNSSSDDETVGIYRDPSGNLVFLDGTNAPITLTQVASGTLSGMLDGGFAASVYLAAQNYDGGDANG